MAEETDYEWAREFETKGTVILHRVAMRVGKVKKFWDATTPETTHPKCGDVGAVLEMESGDVFLASRKFYQPLDPKELRFLELTGRAVQEAVKQIAAYGHALGISEKVGMAVVSDVFDKQAFELRPKDAEQAM